ncbi:unnamed protein product [Peronospora farinosa]|uniref:RxLR effector protein n=1 Tax=Peronospora farinosa TaxID=134698 RepID=A0ABN8CFI5_9STRA|nr:unnamed protein product [Peronospora farinosa]
MSIELNTAYTKALIVFVALVVNSSTSVAGDTPIPVDAVRTSRALNALNEVNTTLSVQRLLRDTSDVVSNAEERFSITDVPILNSVSEKAAAWLAPKSKWALQKSSNNKFTELNIHNREATKLFQVEAFHTWIAYVEKFHPNSVEKVSNAIYSTLASHFSASDLTLNSSRIRWGTIWLNYLYLLKENSDLEVLKILQDKFDDALVARMLYDSFSVNEIAKKLQEAQYKTWKAGTARIPLGMADKGDGDQLLKMTGAYFNWIKAQYA